MDCPVKYQELYKQQDKILALLTKLDTGFYLIDIYSITRHCPFSWSEMIGYALKKSIFAVDLLVDRLRSFPVSLLDTITVADKAFPAEAKEGIAGIADDILNGRDNVV